MQRFRGWGSLFLSVFSVFFSQTCISPVKDRKQPSSFPESTTQDLFSISITVMPGLMFVAFISLSGVCSCGLKLLFGLAAALWGTSSTL